MVLTGKVLSQRVEGMGVSFELEEISRTPVPSSGPKPGILWTVFVAPYTLDPSLVGKTISVSDDNYRPASRECENRCSFGNGSILIFDK